LADILQKSLCLAAIIGEVTQAADMVQESQFLQLAG